MLHHKVLGVPPNFTEKELKDAFRREALKCHPDTQVNASPQELQAAKQRFNQIQQAYETLSKAKRYGIHYGGYPSESYGYASSHSSHSYSTWVRMQHLYHGGGWLPFAFAGMAVSGFIIAGYFGRWSSSLNSQANGESGRHHLRREAAVLVGKVPAGGVTSVVDPRSLHVGSKFGRLRDLKELEEAQSK